MTETKQQLKNAELLERLDDLPFTPRHRKVLFASGIGWAFDAMDVGLITYIIAVLSVQWDLTGFQKSWVVSAGFIGMAARLPTTSAGETFSR